MRASHRRLARSHRSAWIPTVLLLVVFVAGCTGSPDTARGTGATLTIGMPFLSDPPDPVQGGFNTIQMGLAETLFKLGRDLRPEPWLATSAHQVDARTWEISLRSGVRFHDGAVMDATAVKASLERAIALSPTAKVLLNVAEISVRDPAVLIITTHQRSPILPGLLAEPTTAIVNAAAAQAMGAAFTDAAILTGPYKVERFQLDREAVVTRHAAYWGPEPQAERVRFIYLADNQSRVLALQSGDIDIASYVAPESVSAMQRDQRLAVRPAAPVALEFMYLNLHRTPWQDLRVRKALASAINRDDLVRAVMGGQGIAAAGIFPPAFLACAGLTGTPFDPAAAQHLLRDAGYVDADGDGYVEKDGRALTLRLLTYRQRPELVPMAEAIQGSLRRIGVLVQVVAVEQINAALEQPDWDGALYFNNMTSTGDPAWALRQFFATGGGANRGGYANSTIDDLIAQVSQAGDRADRERHACAASRLVVDELPIVPLLYPHVNYGVSARVVGFDTPHPFFLYFVDSALGKK